MSSPVQNTPIDPVQQPAVPSQGIQQTIQPVMPTPVVQNPQHQMEPPIITPVGKEGNPVLTQSGNEFATNPDIALHPEVAAAGVEVNPTPEDVVTPEAQAAGVILTKAVAPVPKNPVLVTFPPERVDSIVTAPHKVFTKSILWLATLIQKVFIKQQQEVHKQKEVV